MRRSFSCEVTQRLWVTFSMCVTRCMEQAVLHQLNHNRLELCLQGRGWNSSDGNCVGQGCKRAVWGMVLDVRDALAPELAMVEMRVLSQFISASSCERNWSAHWHIRSKLRNRLEPATTEKLISSPSLDPDFCYPFNETNYFSVHTFIVLPNMVCLRKFASRLLKISITAQVSAENQTKNILQKSAKTPLMFEGLEHPTCEMKNSLLVQPGKGVFWGGLEGVLCMYISPKGVWQLSKEQGLVVVFWAKWDPIWAKWDICTKSGQKCSRIGEKQFNHNIGHKCW